MDYYTFYKIRSKIHREKCSIYQVEFPSYFEGCGKPKEAVLKIVEKIGFKYAESELKQLSKASQLSSSFLQIYHCYENKD